MRPSLPDAARLLLRKGFYFIFYFNYRHICETPVTEQTFIEQLHELHHKIDFAKEQSFKGALSVNDVGDVLEKLKVKVIWQIWMFSFFSFFFL